MWQAYACLNHVWPQRAIIYYSACAPNLDASPPTSIPVHTHINTVQPPPVQMDPLRARGLLTIGMSQNFQEATLQHTVTTASTVENAAGSHDVCCRGPPVLAGQMTMHICSLPVSSMADQHTLMPIRIPSIKLGRRDLAACRSQHIRHVHPCRVYRMHETQYSDCVAGHHQLATHFGPPCACHTLSI